MNTTPKRSIKNRLKHRTPEIIAGASVVAAVVGFIYIRKTLDFGTATAFAAHAADPSIEIIAGNEEAFVVMTAEALEKLYEVGKLEILNQTTLEPLFTIIAN